MTRRIPASVIWAVPALLSVHDTEEALTVADYLPVTRSHAPAFAAPALDAITLPVFMTVLALVTVAPVLIAACAERPRRHPWAPWTLCLVQAVVALNVVWHVAAAVVLRGYAPGLLTAVLVNLPFSVYVFRRGAAEDWCPAHRRPGLLFAAVAVHAVGLPILFAVVSLVVG